MAGEFFIWTGIDGTSRGCGDRRDLGRAAAKSGSELVVCNLSNTLPIFRREFPDTEVVFDIGGMASLAGLTIDGMKFWLKQTPPVCPADKVPATGKGVRRIWSWKAAFLVFVLGGLARRGVPLPALGAIYDEFTRAMKRGKRLVPA